MFSVCERRRVLALRQLFGIRMVAKDNLVPRIHHLSEHIVYQLSGCDLGGGSGEK
jgi:hypothetical protein